MTDTEFSSFNCNSKQHLRTKPYVSQYSKVQYNLVFVISSWNVMIYKKTIMLRCNDKHVDLPQNKKEMWSSWCKRQCVWQPVMCPRLHLHDMVEITIILLFYLIWHTTKYKKNLFKSQVLFWQKTKLEVGVSFTFFWSGFRFKIHHHLNPFPFRC